LRASKVTYFDSLGLLGDAELEKLMLLELKTMKAIIAGNYKEENTENT